MQIKSQKSKNLNHQKPKPMDNEKFISVLKKLKYGERARVMFDMLMEHLNAEQDITKSGFFDKMKDAINGENEAQKELMEMTKPQPKKKRVSSSN